MARREDYDIVLRATDQTAAAFASAKRGVESLNGAVGVIRGGLAGLAAAFVGQEIVSFAREAVSSLGDIGSAAKRVGVTTDALQTLRFEVEQGGGHIQDADAALQKFADTASKAGTGSNYLTKVFTANGVALKDASGHLKSADDLLGSYAKLVANAASPQDKLRLAVEAFGKQAGPQMVEVLEKIAKEGLPAIIAATKAAGVVIDTALIDKADEIDKKWKALSLRIETYIKSGIVAAIANFPQEDSPLAHFLAMLKGNEKWSITIDATPEPGSVLDWLWQHIRPGAAAILGEPRPSFTDRFSAASGPGSKPSKNIALVDSIKEYQEISDKAQKAVESLIGTGNTKMPLNNDALQKQIDTISKHIAAMEADATAVDATAGAQEALRVRTQLLEVAHQHGIPVIGEYAKNLADLEARAKGAADALAMAKAKSDIQFNRDQLGRNSYQQEAASTLRSLKIDANSAAGQLLASQIQLNAALKDTKDLAADALKGFIGDLRAGKSAAEAFTNVLDKILNKLTSLAVDDLLSAIFAGGMGGGGGGGGGGGIFSKIFGFAGGGEFAVGGSGGTDSQLVAFRASPDETVKISTPAQNKAGANAGGGIIIQMPVTIDARGADQAAVIRIGQGLQEMQRTLPQQIGGATRGHQVRGTRY